MAARFVAPANPEQVSPREMSPHDDAVRKVLMNFRQIVGSAKRHFGLVRTQTGISGAQLWALWQVGAEPGLRVNQLAQRLSIHQSTASNLLEQLEAKGLIRRERLGRDQRVVKIFLTQAGGDLLRKAPGPMRGVLPDAIYQLPEVTLTQLNAALETVMHYIESKNKKEAKSPLSDFLS